MTNGTIKPIRHSKYDQAFPEQWPYWELLDSPKFTRIAQCLRDAIREDLQSRERIKTPGLRTALNLIGAEADFCDYSQQ